MGKTFLIHSFVRENIFITSKAVLIEENLPLQNVTMFAYYSQVGYCQILLLHLVLKILKQSTVTGHVAFEKVLKAH